MSWQDLAVVAAAAAIGSSLSTLTLTLGVIWVLKKGVRLLPLRFGPTRQARQGTKDALSPDTRRRIEELAAAVKGGKRPKD